jgi:hypothetical protein
MMLFITWNIENDEIFRATYLAATNEFVQENPLVSGNIRLIGTSRATMTQLESVAGIERISKTLPEGDWS